MKIQSKIALSLVAALAFASNALAGGILSLEPGPVDFSGGFDGRATDDGRVLQLIVPGTHPWFISDFFPPSQYAVDCQTPYVLARAETAKTDTPEIREYRVCRITQAPVVTKEFLDRLKVGGYRYSLSFAYADGHNRRALVFWTSGGAERGKPPIHQGFARIEGLDWKDQYQPAARCVDPEGRCTWRYFEHGDAFGAFIHRFSGSDRQAAARVFQEVGFDPTRHEAVTGATIVIDPWLADTAAGATPAASCAIETEVAHAEGNGACSLAKSPLR